VANQPDASLVRRFRTSSSRNREIRWGQPLTNAKCWAGLPIWSDSDYLFGWVTETTARGDQSFARFAMGGFYKRGCQEKILLPFRRKGQLSDIQPPVCGSMCCPGA